jgi:hypothetical protein
LLPYFPLEKKNLNFSLTHTHTHTHTHTMYKDDDFFSLQFSSNYKNQYSKVQNVRSSEKPKEEGKTYNHSETDVSNLFSIIVEMTQYI